MRLPRSRSGIPSMALASEPAATGSLPSASDRSALMVRNTGLSGRGCDLAVEAGRSTATSTVDSGAATMKMMSSTSITSMKGVTLISCSSALPSSSPSRRAASGSLRRPGDARPLPGTVEIARDQAQHLGRGVADECAVAGNGTRELVVDDDRRNGGDEADGGRQQRLGDAGRDDGEVGGLCFGNADEAVHDAPYGAEQADERGGGADGGEHAGAPVHLPARGQLEPRQPGGDALLEPGLVGDVLRQLKLEPGSLDQCRHHAAAAPEAR